MRSARSSPLPCLALVSLVLGLERLEALADQLASSLWQAAPSRKQGSAGGAGHRGRGRPLSGASLVLLDGKGGLLVGSAHNGAYGSTNLAASGGTGLQAGRERRLVLDSEPDVASPWEQDH